MQQRSCVHCGDLFRPTSRTQRFCSKSCGATGAHRAQRTCGHCGAAFSPGSNRAQYCKACAPGRGRARWWISCAWCYERRVVTKRSARFCSHECYRAWKARPTYGPPVPPRPAPVVALARWPQALDRGRVESSGRTFFSGPCRRCGEHFTIIDQAASSYCSLKCQRADCKDRRRVLKRGAAGGELVYRKRIFERDRWICQLCGRRVKRSAVAPHPKSPTIDHIVPLAEGGRHEPANVQCAHFICNALKGAGVAGAGEQLRLIG